MKFDIIIIGGGMVGAALACALGKGPWKIALIDAIKPSHEDKRLIALNEGSCSLFHNIDIWSNLTAHAAPIQQIHVSHQGHFGITCIAAQELGLATLGHVIPASHINAALAGVVGNVKNITFICPATLKTLVQSNDIVTVSVASVHGTEEYTADIVIGADGSHSTVRELLGISAQKIDYHQSALVTITELARDHKSIAYERFQEEGAIAMLPLTGTRAATIWTASNSRITHLMQLNEQAFLQQLQQQFGYRLGRLQKTEKRAIYPLYMQQAQQLRKQNVLLMGNAAHTVHPIAAQGLNLALYEVALLTDYLLEQKTLKQCLQNLPPDYLQQNFRLSLGHSLTELFAKKAFPFTLARQAGMIGLDQCLSLKKRFFSHATGKAGYVPRLLLKETELLAK